MQAFPYITPYINDVFAKEKTQWDFILLRPLLLVFYFFLRFISFPIKFILRRWPIGCEGLLIDWCMAFGMKYRLAMRRPSYFCGTCRSSRCFIGTYWLAAMRRPSQAVRN